MNTSDFFDIEGHDPIDVSQLPDEEKIVKKSPFDWINNISSSREHWTVDSSYNMWMAAKAFLQHQDTVFIVSELTKLNITDPQAHYDFLFYSVPKRKRFGKWAKEIKSDDEELLEYIQEKFCYNRKNAIQTLEVLPQNEIELLKKEFQHGKI